MDEPSEKSLRATEEIAGSPGVEGAAGQPLNVRGDLADIAAVFVDSLKALDAVAAEQAKLLVGIAIRLAEAARSPGRGEFGCRGPGINSSDLEADTLVASVKQAADSQMKAFDVAQGRLAELTADLKSDSRPHAGSLLSADPYASVGAALANMVSNLNLAQQNAIANQQAMNSIAQAAIAAGLNLLYSTGRPAGPREG
jgi:hypothetical protein